MREFTTSFILLLLWHAGLACGCITEKISRQELKKYPFIVKARIISLSGSSNTGKTCTVIIEEKIKGRISSDTITVNTPSEGMCGLALENGQNWILTLYPTDSDQFETVACGRSFEVKKDWDNEQARLIKKLKNYSATNNKS